LLLSTERARHVRDQLVEKGVDAELISVTSHGEDNPLIPTPDEVAEPKNRRVEVVVR
jgi:outer membrane protein OmpA-like peptidoglycan-associated protein